jgi:ADP-ribose pyrophosphatase YjhB (NUDIX family)
MAYRAYAILDDRDKEVIVMGTKKTGYLEGFLVFFGGRVEDKEPTKAAVLRELKEESHDRVRCEENDIYRFEQIHVTDPQPAILFFYRCSNPIYKTGEIPFGQEIGSVVAVSVPKILSHLPSDPSLVTPELVAKALIAVYAGGGAVKEYYASGIMKAMRKFLVEYYYDAAQRAS